MVAEDDQIDKRTVINLDISTRTCVDWSNAYNVLCRYQQPARISVLEGFLNVSRNLYESRDLTDVVLVATAGDQQTDFPAHKLVLQAASNVFRAMLTSSDWKENRSSRVSIQTSSAALDNFLSLIYTGCLSEAQISREGVEAVKVLLDTSELTERYQVEWASEALIHKLRGQISQETFELLASFALRHGSKNLQVNCQEFAKEEKQALSDEDWKRWLDGLSEESRTLADGGDCREAKRRRRLL